MFASASAKSSFVTTSGVSSAVRNSGREDCADADVDFMVLGGADNVMAAFVDEAFRSSEAITRLMAHSIASLHSAYRSAPVKLGRSICTTASMLNSVDSGNLRVNACST